MRAGKICAILIGFVCILGSQCPLFAQDPAPTPTPQTSSQNQPDSELNLIHLGDEIEIDVVGSVDYDWRGSLTPEGFLSGLDLLEDPVFALCRSEEEIAGEIAKAFGKILREPKVVVRILDRSNRPNSTLFGAVRTPQRFLIRRPVYLNELIILAGGFTDKASGEIQVFRPASLSCSKQTAGQIGSGETNPDERARFIAVRQDNGSQYINIRISDLLSGKKESNIQVLAGDVVNVFESKPVYVIGGVVNPRQIATRSEMTLSRAISGAGGLAKNADPTRITIFRRNGRETKVIEADLEKIKAEQAADIVLQAFDIVDVPQKGNEKRKYPPVVKVDEAGTSVSSKLPLRIID